ncbi:uncharacterized protein LOC124274796 [Haliotis rubra]|uniref:uncharacterized protein LOC124274796 n=1 Tax=Haliotis rubra TaxID=36100 RepID=UPI001EE59CD9|nr:uncharacterized protein LOC124274796 [Haliotis rubra]XP_046566129.1 uncharacterized protein LOC124274796 [Haliotis rubra]
MTLDSSSTLNEAGLTHECTLSLTYLSEHDTVQNTGSAVGTVAGEREIEGPMDVTDQSQARPGHVMQSRVCKAMNTKTRIHGIREERTVSGTAQNSTERMVTSRLINMPGQSTALATDVMMPVETNAATATSTTRQNPWRFPNPPPNANQQVSNTEMSLVHQIPQTTVPFEPDSGDNGGQRGYFRYRSECELWLPQPSDAPSSLPLIHRSHSDYNMTCNAIPGPMSSSLSLPSLLQDPIDAVPDRILDDLAGRLGNDWYTLGLRLGLETHHLDAIKHDERDDLRNQAYQMLCRWKKTRGKHATLETLCARLRECELAAHADSIEEWNTNVSNQRSIRN